MKRERNVFWVSRDSRSELIDIWPHGGRPKLDKFGIYLARGKMSFPVCIREARRIGLDLREGECARYYIQAYKEVESLHDIDNRTGTDE